MDELIYTASVESISDLAEYSWHARRLSSSGGRSNEWHHDVVWTYSDGTQSVLRAKHSFDRPLPARLGYQVISLEFTLATNEPTVHRQAVIGWRTRIMRADETQWRPILQEENLVRQSFRSAVLQPDGHLISSDGSYADEAAFIRTAMTDWLTSKQRQRLVLEEKRKECPFCAERREREDDRLPF
jgi:hypothetical protein